jgi:zinc D-Ala-D-Ala dipeptidase
MFAKRFFYLLSIVLGIVLIPSTPALLQSINSSSVTEKNKNSIVQDNPAPLPSITGSKPSAPLTSTTTNDNKNSAQSISAQNVNPSVPVTSIITSDNQNSAKAISAPNINPSVLVTPTITNDNQNSAKVISTPELKSSILIPKVKVLKAPPKPSVITTPKNDLVDLEKIAPHIIKDIRYATSNNFINRKLYPVARCLLHAKVAEQLKQVQIELEKDNLGLKVFDCYRPLSIQKQMWKMLPDNKYVANPAQGSRHNRASAVDLTLVNFSTRKDKEMPSKYDEFSIRSHMDYKAASTEAKKNRNHLRMVMQKHGFKSIPTEWWHYDSSEWQQYPLLDISWN